MKAEYERLARDCRNGRSTLLDCYGATDIGEFFAVATECFVQQPSQMRQRHPKLYKRSEEHTSELQSPCNLVCRLLLEKKKNGKLRLKWQRGRFVLTAVRRR